ncbi:MAG: PA2778 family cysteine peptidase [Piscinibacter sp.]|uniref:PA2778 family cysteine peptidase n=1 Tax=Piscinibacter sp. TaxID=1903157 RepID=UPI003D0F9D74
MPRRAWLAAALALLMALLAGCAVQTETLRRAPPSGLAPRVELAATPFFPQTEYHCGPAALATVLAGWPDIGREATPQRLGDEVFLPARTGTLQIEMIAGARRHGAVATKLPGTLEALLRELQAGHPVVVLQNLGLSWYPAWHYAVLVGYDLEAGDVILRSGTTERQVLPMRTFEHTWVRAGSWAFVALPPGQWPATAEEAAVVEAAVGFERAAAPAQAVRAYRSALQRFGGSLSLQMGLGNSLHASGDRAAAAQAFEDATRLHPGSAPAWINLASTRADLGQREAALAAARQGVAVADATWSDRARALLASLQAQAKDSPSPR